jgi:hypothetical protein
MSSTGFFKLLSAAATRFSKQAIQSTSSALHSCKEAIASFAVRAYQVCILPMLMAARALGVASYRVLISPVLGLLKFCAVAIYNHILKPIGQGAWWCASWVGQQLAWVFLNILLPIWMFIWNSPKYLYYNVLLVFYAHVLAPLGRLMKRLSLAIHSGVVMPIYRGIKWALVSTWGYIIVPVARYTWMGITGIKWALVSTWGYIIVPVARYTWMGITGLWRMIITAVAWVVNKAVMPVLKRIWSSITWTFHAVLVPLWELLDACLWYAWQYMIVPAARWVHVNALLPVAQLMHRVAMAIHLHILVPIGNACKAALLWLYDGFKLVMHYLYWGFVHTVRGIGKGLYWGYCLINTAVIGIVRLAWACIDFMLHCCTALLAALYILFRGLLCCQWPRSWDDVIDVLGGKPASDGEKCDDVGSADLEAGAAADGGAWGKAGKAAAGAGHHHDGQHAAMHRGQESVTAVCSPVQIVVLSSDDMLVSSSDPASTWQQAAGTTQQQQPAVLVQDGLSSSGAEHLLEPLIELPGGMPDAVSDCQAMKQ